MQRGFVEYPKKPSYRDDFNIFMNDSYGEDSFETGEFQLVSQKNIKSTQKMRCKADWEIGVF